MFGLLFDNFERKMFIKKKIQKKFRVDEIDKMIARFKPHPILSNKEAKESFDSFKKILKKYRYDNEEGYKRLFIRLKKQLVESNSHIKNFEITDKNIWLLFHVRNIRLLYASRLGRKISKIVLNYSAKMEALINSRGNDIFVSDRIYDKPISRLVSFYIAIILNAVKIKRQISKLKERPISILGLYDDTAESISNYVMGYWSLHRNCPERYGIIHDIITEV